MCMSKTAEATFAANVAREKLQADIDWKQYMVSEVFSKKTKEVISQQARKMN